MLTNGIKDKAATYLPQINYYPTTILDVILRSILLHLWKQGLFPLLTLLLGLHQRYASSYQRLSLWTPLCKTGPAVHKEMYHNHILHYKDAISSAKTTHYATLIREVDRSTRARFSTINNILKPPDALPLHLLTVAQCDYFMTFFDEEKLKTPDIDCLK